MESLRWQGKSAGRLTVRDSSVQVDRKKLKPYRSKDVQKYLILLSNQLVILDDEFSAMKKARLSGKAILEMYPTNRVINRTTTLTHLLEENEQKEKARKEAH